MAERPNLDRDPQYSETTDPRNPPNSVLRPAARRSALWTYVGGIAAVFLIVAAVLAYRLVTGAGGDSELDVTQPSITGTSGDDNADPDSPGGFDPAPEPDSTRDEIEFRGGGTEPQGPMPGLSTSTPLTELGAMVEEPPQSVAGRRIDVQDVEVESVQGSTLMVRDGDARVSVVAPGGTPEARAGQRVNVSGTVEPDGRGRARIRATRVDVR
jgi:hypothetical protein